MDEKVRINRIELALYSKWIREDNGLIMLLLNPMNGEALGEVNFIAPTTEGTGMSSFKYKVFIKDNDPYITFVDPKNDEEKEYIILEIHENNILRLKSKAGIELNFHHGK